MFSNTNSPHSHQPYSSTSGSATYGTASGVSQQKPSLDTQDCVGNVLNDLKRICGEYATACTECRDPETRHLFQNLLNSTLQSQRQVFDAMQSHGWYKTTSTALRQEIDKQIQHYQQTWQQAQQFMQQTLAFQQPLQSYAPTPQGYAHPPQSMSNY
ncbi:spore coat protein [Paenibacillus thermoaerophilus]|uniref:Spore coat protein n=1 Tax=Paenibacillus thermoaerophilus TaxID=1215385 RepID=A0ABW2V513_9BACL|nr:spore coat protein [Paenibacillus thermoaerophilus]TMV11011.1 spore coat protein [Paenibacillus thermoaerophilus]